MKTTLALVAMLLIGVAGFSQQPKTYKSLERDTLKTARGPIVITFVGHASLMLEIANKYIQIDPVSTEANYTQFPKADFILLTHEHDDHLDKKAINDLTKPSTMLLISKVCADILPNATVMLNGVSQTFDLINIQAVPAYNIVNKRNGVAYHEKGDGNGYVISYGGKKVYIAGDTENIPEMKDLRNVDMAFIPILLPFTMTAQMAAEAALSFKPKVLYPYHMGNTDLKPLFDGLKGSGIEVRVRKMK